MQEIESAIAALESRHRSPKTLGGVVAEQDDLITRYGCPYGTLSSELAKRAEGSKPPAAPLMQILLDWAEGQFRAMGRRDAHDLAVELLVTYQGSAVLASTLGQPELMARQARRLEKWIETLQV